MADPVRSADVEARCERLQYPAMRADAAAAFADVTVDADGQQTNLGVVISELDRDSFDNPDDLYDELVSSVEEREG